jgi:hypothetical protein
MYVGGDQQALRAPPRSNKVEIAATEPHAVEQFDGGHGRLVERVQGAGNNRKCPSSIAVVTSAGLGLAAITSVGFTNLRELDGSVTACSL